MKMVTPAAGYAADGFIFLACGFVYRSRTPVVRDHGAYEGGEAALTRGRPLTSYVAVNKVIYQYGDWT